MGGVGVIIICLMLFEEATETQDASVGESNGDWSNKWATCNSRFSQIGLFVPSIRMLNRSSGAPNSHFSLLSYILFLGTGKYCIGT